MIARDKSQIGVQFGFVGLLVTSWNELETRVRSVLLLLTPDPLTAMMLAADYQIGTLINATRMMAKERKWLSERINAQLRKKRRRTKLYEPFFEHVEHFLDWVDILREYRNFYVHNVFSAHGRPTLLIQKISARGRVSFYTESVDSDDLKRLIADINECIIYSDRLLRALEKNESKSFYARPTWPKRPPLPAKLKTHPTALQDVVPQLRSSPTLFRSRFRSRLRALERDRLSEKKI